MLYGAAYDEGPRECGCGERRPRHYGECHDCGEYGCEACMEFREGAFEPGTGYSDTGLICESCKAKAAA